jgi:hypothetical protein
MPLTKQEVLDRLAVFLLDLAENDDVVEAQRLQLNEFAERLATLQVNNDETIRANKLLIDSNEALARKVLELERQLGSIPARVNDGLILEGPYGPGQTMVMLRASESFDGAPRTAVMFYPPNKVHSKAVSRGLAPVEWDGSRLIMTLAAKDATPKHSATGTHEIHLPFHEPTKFVRYCFTTVFLHLPEQPWDWGLTGKRGGPVGFHDEAENGWKNWPGGGTFGPKNASIRLTHWRYFDEGQAKPSPRLCMYLYLGGSGAPTVVQRDPATQKVDRPAYVFTSNHGHTHECHLQHFIPKVNEPINEEIRAHAGTAGKADGWAEYWINGVLMLKATNIPFFASGPAMWNRGYQSYMLGGESSRFAPDTPTQSVRVALSNLKVYDR